MSGRYYHGGKAGLVPGDVLFPAPPHVEDGCPICVARASGDIPTVGMMRRMLRRRKSDPTARKILALLAGEPDSAPLDPPSAHAAVYVTTSPLYATWYAARSRGDLYIVDPIGELAPSTEDPFPTWRVASAVVLQAIRRDVRLVRRERREIERVWAKADRLAARRAAS